MANVGQPIPVANVTGQIKWARERIADMREQLAEADWLLDGIVADHDWEGLSYSALSGHAAPNLVNARDVLEQALVWLYAAKALDERAVRLGG